MTQSLEHDFVEPGLLEPMEQSFESSIRPSSLQQYIGQEAMKEQLSIFLKAAQHRKEPLDHCLIAGPPGLGKTTLAHIIAYEMRAQLHCVTGPHVEKKGDLAAVLSNLQPGDVLFVDEIHRMPKAIEEVLYSAMEDFKLDLMIGQGPSARTLKLDLPQFTLIGATTRSGLLSNPLRDRFGIQLRLDFYPTQELQHIVKRSALILRCSLTEEAAYEVAKRARGTPRIANRILRRLRDYFQVHIATTCSWSVDMASQALHYFQIDDVGLDTLDRRFLKTIMEKFSGGPVGIETLSAALGEDLQTLEETVEPFLLQLGFLQRTPRGRIASLRAYQHFNLTPPVAL